MEREFIMSDNLVDHVAALPSSGSIPAGIITMWSGFLSAIPTGWALCDGTNGTPDLRGMFIKGSTAGTDPGVTGGSATHGHDAHGALSHSGCGVADHAAQSHTGTAVSSHSGCSVAQHAALTHSGCAVASHTVVSTKQGSSSGNVVTTATHTVTQPDQHAAQTHTVTQAVDHTVTQPAQHAALSHSVTQAADHASQSHSSASNEPPFYSLAFIMKS